MTSVVSLELVLDDEADAAVRREWDALRRADLPSQARHTGASNRPHLTLLVRSSLGPVEAAPLTDLLPLPLTLGAPLVFGGRRTCVIARSVIPTAELLELHAAVHGVAGAGDDADHTVPGAWTPHVTLARRVPVERMSDALGVLSEAGEGDLLAEGVQIRRWDAAARAITHVAGRDTLESC